MALRIPRFRTGPQPFEIVELTLFGCEDVHDHAARINQDPIAVTVAFGPGDMMAAFFDGFNNRIGDGTCLYFGASGDDHKSIRNNGSAFQIDDLKVFAFFIERRVAHDIK